MLPLAQSRDQICFWSSIIASNQILYNQHLLHLKKSLDNFMIWLKKVWFGKSIAFLFCLKTISAVHISTFDYNTVPAGVVVNFTIQSQSDASGFGYPRTTKRSSLTLTSVLTCKLLSPYPNSVGTSAIESWRSSYLTTIVLVVHFPKSTYTRHKNSNWCQLHSLIA